MATFLIGLLNEAASDVTIDSSGLIELGTGGLINMADDWFADARAALSGANDAEVSALYELGVTKGTSLAAVQNDTEPPLDFDYEPDSTVTRGAMAAFITRALAHTSVRPAGVSAQYDGADVIVSVRDAQFRPVSRTVVDVFWTTTDQADNALSTDGTCRHSAVTQADRSSLPCEIDFTDPITGNDGESRVAVAGLRRVPAGGATVWVWTGQIGGTLEAGARTAHLRRGRGCRHRFRLDNPRYHVVQRPQGPLRQHGPLHRATARHRRQRFHRRQRHRSRAVEPVGGGHRRRP